ncbi:MULTISPECIES: C39 family peptidase [unclassified Microcoleus]|uniref:C39 family peptidase n=1 Tax=unclassified Microcoleus TaxID=2642155 RepID=UPI002FD1D808
MNIDCIRLNIPYKSQIDNKLHPSGTCNTTSIAMIMEGLGVKRKNPSLQLEDELTAHMRDTGLSRHSPQDLARVVRQYGLKDTFKDNATIEEVKKHLLTFNGVVIHGYFTDSGHIVVGTGFNRRGFYIHDPWGEYFDSGYRNDLPGAHLLYSYDLIRRTCMTDNQFWVHFISK